MKNPRRFTLLIVSFPSVGTLANQSINGVPVAATNTGKASKYDGALSFLPGQRLSACSCPGSDHPGPKLGNGSFAGRSAPEIDIFEAQVDDELLTGHMSMSSQWAPFNAHWQSVLRSAMLGRGRVAHSGHCLVGITTARGPTSYTMMRRRP